jgi:UDPglucose 6-dehydrogenase
MRIAVIGTGYVGLVSGACLADIGHDVTCVDKDQRRLSRLLNEEMPFFEPGLAELVKANADAGKLRFAAEVPLATDVDAVFISVGTPSRRGDGYADLSFVYQVARDLAASIADFTVVILKSTVPVGVGDEVERILAEVLPTDRFSVVSNPEFLREGAAIQDFMRPDRIVIGTEDRRAQDVMRAIYEPLVDRIMFCRRRDAELIKYASNAFLATKVAFINEIAELCEAVGCDIEAVAHGMGLDNRIGSKFLAAGPGYGGSCFPKDTTALIKTANDNGVSLRIVETVTSSNAQRPRAMARKVMKALGGQVRGCQIGILGLAFKPNTDDMREAPAIPLIRGLQDMGATICAFDPAAMTQARPLLEDVQYSNNAYECARQADALVVVTGWDEFKALDLSELKRLMAKPVVVDLRNIFKPEDMQAAGFRYFSVGRSSSEITP